MRAAFLTGQYIWQIREAGTHASSFPRDLATFPAELRKAGYRIGYTGKGWGPGNFAISGRDENPAGPAFSASKMKSPDGISSTDYSQNFAGFLDEHLSEGSDQPFCFWYGGHEPHRGFGRGLGKQSGMDPEAVDVPKFLPDSPQVREDMLDYFYEIQWFDRHLANMLRELEQRGQLENTLVIVTSDNGMSFPRAKANLYEFGIHMPLAISWPAKIPASQQSRTLVNLIDVTATIYEACSVPPPALSGRSLLSVMNAKDSLTIEDDARRRQAVFSGRERHSSSRYNSLGYPCRCVRPECYLYIRNYAPERWPAGTPQKFDSVVYDQDGTVLSSRLGKEHGGYHDIDGCPTLDWMIQNRSDPVVNDYLQAAVAKRPAEELFDIQSDPACMTDLASRVMSPSALSDAERSAIESTLQEHRQLLDAELTRTADLRHTDFEASHVWEMYPRSSSLRWFPSPEWALEDPTRVPVQPWLASKRAQ